MAYQHKEAFCLMTYACGCGHEEQIWNSRDGVTPFQLSCPSCGGRSLAHINFEYDDCKPDHTLFFGQRFFSDITKEEADSFMSIRATQAVFNRNRLLTNDEAQDLFNSIYMGGKAPMVKVSGYDRQKF